MENLETFSNIDQIRKFFDFSYIKDRQSLNNFLSSKSSGEITLYRGEESPSFKLYNSAQRFYANNKSELDGLSYNEFIKALFGCSKTICNPLLAKLYEKIKYNNIIELGKDIERIDYNQLWAFSALQHFSMCAPCIDFSVDPYVALFFAAEKLIADKTQNFLTGSNGSSEFENYIAIVSFEESKDLINAINLQNINSYGSYVEYLIDAPGVSVNLRDAADAIQNADFLALPKGQIRYITYGSKSTTIIGKAINYTFNFENPNIIPQEGRLYVMNSETETFEKLWKSTFAINNNAPKLKITLISKQLRSDIQEIISQKGYSREKLIISSYDAEDEIRAECKKALNRKKKV